MADDHESYAGTLNSYENPQPLKMVKFVRKCEELAGMEDSDVMELDKGHVHILMAGMNGLAEAAQRLQFESSAVSDINKFVCNTYNDAKEGGDDAKLTRCSRAPSREPRLPTDLINAPRGPALGACRGVSEVPSIIQKKKRPLFIRSICRD